MLARSGVIDHRQDLSLAVEELALVLEILSVEEPVSVRAA
jgi:hypothetical protein